MILGLTGGIASGKTFCSDYLKTKGVTVIDADEIARAILVPQSKGLALVVKAFGEGILDKQGQLNRQALRERVFSNDEARKKLNKITHPLIRQSLLSQLDNAIKTPYAILSAPLLFENDLQQYCDVCVLIDVPESIQLARGAARDKQNKQAIKAIMAKQMSRSEKIRKANYIIDNAGERELTRVQLNRLHNILLANVA